MDRKRKVIFDIEANNLLNYKSLDYSTSPYKLKPSFKLHCIVVKDIDTQERWAFYDGPTHNFLDVNYTRMQLSEFRQWVKENVGMIAGHNIINYDLLVLELYFGMKFNVGPDLIDGNKIGICDTLILSRLLNPDRFGGHSLDSWGKRVGMDKIKFAEGDEDKWEKFTPEMLYYCFRDVDVNCLAYFAMIKEWGAWAWGNAFALESKVAYIITLQEHVGFVFDKELATWCLEDLNGKLKDIEDRVEPLLPERPMTKTGQKDYTPPATQWKADGSIAKHFENFLIKHGGEVTEWEEVEVGARKKKIIKKPKKVRIYDKIYTLPMPLEPVKETEPMKLSNQAEIKKYLISLGWEPTQWKDRDLTLDSNRRKVPKDKWMSVVNRYLEDTVGTEFEKGRLEELELSCADELVNKLYNHDVSKPCRVPSGPTYTINQDKDLCPNLISLGEKVGFVKDVVHWLTYRHRRNAIFSEATDDNAKKESTGWLTHPRLDIDGRIPTPANTLGCNCVTEDTLLLTDRGMIRVVDVNKGDLVLTHEGVYQPVVDTISNGVHPVVEITTSTGTTVECTYNHPFLDESGNWVLAKDLKQGSKILSYLEPEQWQQVEGLSRYFVSSWGRVMSEEGHYLTPNLRRELWSRAEVDLVFDDGFKSKRGIGDLVLSAFVSPRIEGMEVCHRDGNPCNNTLPNLYWGTSKDNKADSKLHGRHLKAMRSRKFVKLSRESIQLIKSRIPKPYTRGWDSMMAREYGVNREVIKDIRLGYTWRDDYSEYNEFKATFTSVTVKSIREKGVKPTFDVTVEKDHSYVANGFVTHNTSRMQHKDVANVPRTTSMYGEYMRALFKVQPDHWQIGYDADAIEARIEGHHTIKYPGGKPYAEALTAAKPNDTHTLRAKKFQITRDEAKVLKYSCTYGAQGKKIAKQMGWLLDKGHHTFNGFWEDAKPLASCKKDLEDFWSANGREYIVAIDGRKLMTRSKHSLLNTLFQSGGVICMKRGMVILWDQLDSEGLLLHPFRDNIYEKVGTMQLISYHDEAQNTVHKDLVHIKEFDSEDEAKKFKTDVESKSGKLLSEVGHIGDKYLVGYSKIGELCARSVTAGGEYYNLNVPLTAGYNIGKSWKDCH